MLPRRWQNSLRWPDSIVVGLALYVLLCWVATSSRHIPVIYVALIFGAALWGLIAVRFRWLQSTLGRAQENPEMREWLAAFGILYVLAYLLVRPPAGAALLTLPPDGALDLVTYARYAKQLLMFGTANVDFATFEYLRSPASAYLLAWHSLLFLGDPLNAAMPLLFMVAALFGTIAVDLARSLFGLSWRAAMAIAAIAVCAPMFRWALATYSLGELLSATSVLYLIGVVGRAVATRSLNGPIVLGIAAGGTLLFFSARSAVGSPGSIARGVVEVGSPLFAAGVVRLAERGLPPAQKRPMCFRRPRSWFCRSCPFVWAAAVWALRRSPIARSDRHVRRSPARERSRHLCRSRRHHRKRRSAGRLSLDADTLARRVASSLNQIGRMPFRAFTLKVADEPNGLSTALAMYYMPGRKAHVIGRGVPLDRAAVRERVEATTDVHSELRMRRRRTWRHGVRAGRRLPADGAAEHDRRDVYPFNRTFLFLRFRSHDAARPRRPVEYAVDPQPAADSRSATDAPRPGDVPQLSGEPVPSRRASNRCDWWSGGARNDAAKSWLASGSGSACPSEATTGAGIVCGLCRSRSISPMAARSSFRRSLLQNRLAGSVAGTVHDER